MLSCYLTGVSCADQVVGVSVIVSVHLTCDQVPAGVCHGGHVAGQQVLIVPHDLRVAGHLSFGLRLQVIKIFEHSSILCLC